ncbi:hypothetical protein STEG23_003838 [Scotinomys teguina]
MAPVPIDTVTVRISASVHGLQSKEKSFSLYGASFDVFMNGVAMATTQAKWPNVPGGAQEEAPEHLFVEFSKKCSERRKIMSAKEKSKFEDLAKSDKARYDREMKNYIPPKGDKKGKKKDPNAPKRPPSAFFLFCSEYHPKIKMDTGADVSIIAPEFWHPNWPVQELHSGAQYVRILPYEHNLTLNRLYGPQVMGKVSVFSTLALIVEIQSLCVPSAYQHVMGALLTKLEIRQGKPEFIASIPPWEGQERRAAFVLAEAEACRVKTLAKVHAVLERKPDPSSSTLSPAVCSP